MMLQRLAMQDLLTWKQTKTQQALMIMGARQVGKTTLVRSFAKGRYDTFAELNFLGNTQAVQTLKAATNADDLLLRISALTGKTLSPGRTLLFLDEIQECKDLLTWTKFLTERMDIDIILSGSLLGLDAYVQARSFPVGFLRKLTLYPLTFEEFAICIGLIDALMPNAPNETIGRKNAIIATAAATMRPILRTSVPGVAFTDAT